MKHYTVPNAEAVGACLAVQLLKTEKQSRTLSINLDTQAVIKGLNINKPIKEQHIVDHFRKGLNDLTKNAPRRQLTVKWASGRNGVEGNERADKEVKEAAKGSSSDKLSLPKFLRADLKHSVTAVNFETKPHDQVKKKMDGKKRMAGIEKICTDQGF